MSIPTLPAFFDMYYTKQDGKLAPDGYLYNDQMFQALNLAVFILNTMVTTEVMNSGSNQNTIVNQGVKFPHYSTAEITALESNAETGTVWFNTTLSKLQVKTANGIVQTITSA
jgi:hypothetical protein